MDFNDVWLEPTEKLEQREEQGLASNPPIGMLAPLPKSSHSLKKIQLLPLADVLPAAASLPELEFLSTLSPVKDIKPPPTIFPDLWGERDEVSELSRSPLNNAPDHNEVVEENQDLLISEDDLFVPEEKSKLTLPLELDSMAHELWESADSAAEETYEDEPDSAVTLSDNLALFADLDLFDIDAALARQEADLQQAYEREREVSARRNWLERWGGVSSLIYVNWDNQETAEWDALERLGYANIPLSQETRAFIIQAARNARLPHRQEVQLTTQLASARAQLALLPPYDENRLEDLSVTRRREALRAEITEIEYILIGKMQWVAIKKAVQFLGQGVELDDLIQFGMLGVIAGVQHFDISRKTRLLVAVNTWTFQALARAIGDYGSAVRLPAYMIEQVKNLKKQHLQWRISRGCQPTRKELAHAMDISLTQLKAILKAEEVLKASKSVLSLERYVLAENINAGYSFQIPEVDFTASEDLFLDLFEEIDGQQTLHSLFQYLTPKEQQVFSLRAGLDEDGNGNVHTLEEIGQLLGVTRERVRQIEEKARKKIQSQLRKTSPVTNVPPKAEKIARAVPEDKSVQKQTRNSERAMPSPSHMDTPYITKKYVQEIKRKWKEQYM